MKWPKLLDLAPIGLLVLIMASQIYYMARQFALSLSPVVISSYAMDFGNCTVGLPQVGAALSSGLQQYGSPKSDLDVIVTKLAGDQLRIVMQLRDPGAAAFAEETRIVKSLIQCAKPPWCQGTNPDDGNGVAGCEITQEEFRPLGWEVSQRTGNRVDALAVIALLIDAAALFYLLSKTKSPTATTAT